MKKEYKIHLMKPYLGDYLKQYHNIDLNDKFKCINPKCNTNNMSYSARYNICHCFTCNKSYDIFGVVALDYNLNPRSFVKQIQKVLELYPDLDDSH